MRATCAAGYQTSDFYSAAFVSTRPGVRLVDVIWQGRRAEFVFETNGLDVRSELTAFHNGTAMVSAREFVDAISALKRELYAGTPR